MEVHSSHVTDKQDPIVEKVVSPFTDEDIKRLQTEAQGYDEADGWTFFKRTEFAELWRKSDDTSGVPLIKGCLYFPGIPPNEVLELIVNMDIRRRWEKQLPIIETVEEHSDFKVIYWLVKTPRGAADRDFVVYMKHGVDENGVTYVMYKNATHPMKMEVPGVVRGETLFSGTLLLADKDDPNSTRLTLLLQDDIKGYVPKFIINFFYARAPLDWRENLYNFYHNVYKHEKSSK